MVKGAIYLAAPRRQVFGTLIGYGKWEEWVPGCEKCTVASAQGPTSHVELVIGLARKLKMRLRYDAEPDSVLRFQLIAANDTIKTYAGLYRLVDAEDKGTILFAELDLEVRGMPRFLTDGFAKKSLDKTAKALKSYLARVIPAQSAQPTAARLVPAASLPQRRPRRLLQVVKQPGGYRIQLMGQVVTLKNLEGSFGGNFRDR